MIIIAFYTIGDSQSDNVELQIQSDAKLLMTYVDSVQKYLYRDSEKATLYINKSEDLLTSNPSLPDSTLAHHLKAKIYYIHHDGDPLRAFEIFAENRDKIYSDRIPEKLKMSLRYIEAFTYMELGDLESAQFKYYQNIEQGRELNDLKAVSSNLYSLGQLFKTDEKYQAALETFKKLFATIGQTEITSSSWILAHNELAGVYSQLGQYDDALQEIQESIDLAEETNADILKSHAKMIKGEILLNKNKITEAQSIYDELSNAHASELGYVGRRILLSFKGNLYQAQKKYDGAIKIYEELIAFTDTVEVNEIMSFYNSLHMLNSEKNDFKMAYQHLTEYNRLTKKKFEDDRRKETEYLRVKYDSEQKDLDNQLLGAELSKKNLETSLLSSIVGAIVLFCAGLLFLFLQSRRQRRILETEVKKRTLSLQKSYDMLEQSKEEMDEFNRILSHDLKEPIRNIVSYGQLITHDTISNDQTAIYSNIIKNSGVQLYNLIDNVEQYHDVQKTEELAPSMVDINDLIKYAVQKITEKHKTLHIPNISQDVIPPINTYSEELKQVFFHIIENSLLYNTDEEPTIQIKHEEQSYYHLIQIIDNGTGIPKEYHDYVFGMFKRLNTRDQHNGAGLGLSITKKILQKIGGKVNLLNNLDGSGTTVSVYIPKI